MMWLINGTNQVKDVFSIIMIPRNAKIILMMNYYLVEKGYEMPPNDRLGRCEIW